MNITTNTIRSILAELKPGDDFDTSPDFIEDGLLDSFDILSIVQSLEDDLKVDIDGEAIVPENFGSFVAIAALAERAERV